MSDEEFVDDGSELCKPPPPLPEGVRKVVIKEADTKNISRKPKDGDEVTVDYVGSLESDGTEFDSSHSRDAPFVFTLGEGEVVKGLDLGIVTMHKGEVAKFTLQPEFAFGEQGKAPAIPPNATVIFVVELVSWVSKDDLFGDGGVIKSIQQEASGWERPKKGSEVRITLKATAKDGTVLEDWSSRDYTVGSTDLGSLATAVNKALSGMYEGEKCCLTCTKDYASTHGEVAIDLHLEGLYSITDVSLRKDQTVWKKQIKEGEGSDIPQDGCRVTLKVETATDGTTPLPGFTGPREFKFIAGDGDVCDALEAVCVDMKKGERAVLTCNAPSKSCDASIGFSGATEGITKVVLTIEMLDFTCPVQAWKMSNMEKVAVAAARKDGAAYLYKKNRMELALRKYKLVIDGVSDTSNFNDSLKLDAAELKAAAELNKAACYLKLGDFTSTLITCNGVLKTDRHNVKALFRRAKAHYGRDEYIEAINDIERVLQLDPENSEAKALLPHAHRGKKKKDKEGMSTYSKMCQGLGKLNAGEEKKKPEPKAPEPEPPQERSDKVMVSFRMEMKCEAGEHLRVSGSADVLGAWDAAKSIELTLLPPKWEPPTGSHRAPPVHYIWEAVVEVPESEEWVEYKYLVRGPTGDREEGAKHRLHVAGMGGTRQRLTDTWRNY
eukprot:TRINITY_DN68421_c0_g1_i1.p1 TRINITY_DN68421_c0_g1~~TRINITY_DN68421_c0_g1_i1.p1  ORF type:complete len:664 (-),score=123.41 TRINITY_DN68421_c0_g1_i1:278-2269(-)